MSFYRSIATISGLTLGSRLLGFVRDMMMARYAGAGVISDAFVIAFKLPNLFRRIFAEGAFNAAFIPLFTRIRTENDQTRALQFASEVASVLLLVLTLLTLLAHTGMPWLVRALAPGFKPDEPVFPLAVTLCKITFPYLLCISFVSLFSAMLGAFGRFGYGAAAPMWLNITMIGAILLLPPYMPTPGHTLAWGVMAAGIMQVLWMAWAMRVGGLSIYLPRPRLTDDVRQLLKLMGPALLGAGVVQLNILIDMILVTFLPRGAPTYLYYADRINQLPLGIVGYAVGTALLPLLTRLLSSGKPALAHRTQRQAIELSMLVALPATAALIVMAKPIVTVLYVGGAFTQDAANQVAYALQAFSLGIPAYLLLKIFPNAFFARHDTRTPVRTGAISVGVNIILNIILMQFMGHVGIALATAIAAWVNAGQQGWIMVHKKYLRHGKMLLWRISRILLASVLMAAVVYMAQTSSQELWQPSQIWWQKWGILAGLVATGGATYAALVPLLGIGNLRKLRRSLKIKK